ncbi:hypothetical protein D3C87_1746730 [compost metagenome]
MGKYPPATIATRIIPITFCASLPPCAKLKAAEETNCNTLNHFSATAGREFLAILIIMSVIIMDMIIPIMGASTINAMIFSVASILIAWIGSPPIMKA